ncbi:hypothetical protein SCHPADRAFT_938251 [Schizopora paradoxa]|uniref:F-box domain-containing protein n=1 Tax=Schizopora paradoxa TaxID=27342 RepID=A0A0H2RVB0_9AGAM|nr:hypothetical protein SCHPADRAFT_938251 [Schizopora paradoxa]
MSENLFDVIRCLGLDKNDPNSALEARVRLQSIPDTLARISEFVMKASKTLDEELRTRSGRAFLALPDEVLSHIFTISSDEYPATTALRRSSNAPTNRPSVFGCQSPSRMFAGGSELFHWTPPACGRRSPISCVAFFWKRIWHAVDSLLCRFAWCWILATDMKT